MGAIRYPRDCLRSWNVRRTFEDATAIRMLLSLSWLNGHNRGPVHVAFIASYSADTAMWDLIDEELGKIVRRISRVFFLLLNSIALT